MPILVAAEISDSEVTLVTAETSGSSKITVLGVTKLPYELPVSHDDIEDAQSSALEDEGLEPKEGEEGQTPDTAGDDEKRSDSGRARKARNRLIQPSAKIAESPFLPSILVSTDLSIEKSTRCLPSRRQAIFSTSD